ncbi:uncharacterized protein METZ01_LOCUS91901 [marine metagenome]|uniref:Uncharacterized protein n=1 Tax=marine metagenome TaxID=408172 RepID=A0A381VHB7_9ZZZZ
MAKFNDKISTILSGQLPEFIVSEHPKFAEFLKVYYQLLESAELSVTSVRTTEGILLETETDQANNLVLNASSLGSTRTSLDAGDKVIFETYSGTEYGKFTRGETITGQTSNATAVLLTEDLDNGRLFISANNKFITGEIVVGASSNAYATIDNYKPNPVNNIADLVNFRDPDNVISNFLSNFRDEFLATLPDILANKVNKRNLIKNIKSLYRSKGTNRGHEIFFRVLFNEESQTFYPREQILRISDGKYDTLKVMRAIADIGDTTELVGRTITGADSKAYAIVENVAQYQIGADTVTEFILNNDSIQGTFQILEQIQGSASDTDDWYIKATVTGIPGTKTLTNDGSLNTIADTVAVTAGGVGAIFNIDEIGSGGLTEIVINNKGLNYAVGDKLVFDNTGTGGKNAAGFVRVINGGIAGEDSDQIVLEDGTMAADQYFGNSIMQELGTGTGTIEKVFLTYSGTGYTSLPSVTITSLGTGGSVRAWGDEIGRITALKTIELGKKYQDAPSPPVLEFYNSCVLTGATGLFTVGQSCTVSGGQGTIVSYNTSTNVLRIKSITGAFTEGQVLSADSGGSGTIAKIDVATANVNVVSVSDTDGKFINEDGKLSEVTMKVQDSRYYQDFSYVLKVASSIAVWRDAFKKTMHTAGFYFTGQVDITSNIDARGRLPLVGSISGRTEVEIPLIAILNTLFSVIFGRRLGTIDDGTSLRAKPLEPGAIDLDHNTNEHFEANQRDLTLTRPGLDIDYLSRKRATIGGQFVKAGYAYAGPKWGTLNRYANTIFNTSIGGTGHTFEQLNNLKVFGTRTSLDGQGGVFLMTSHPEGKKVKMSLAFPSFLTYSNNEFSNTVTNFSQTGPTFDDTTP